MRSHLLIPAVVGILLLGQPVALAQPLTTGSQPNSSELTNISVPQDIPRDEEEHPNLFEWQGQIQQLQIATSQLLDQVAPTESVSTLKSDFQSKLADLAMAVKLPKLDEGVVSNISTSLGTAQGWSTNLFADTKDKLGNFQQWSANLATDTKGKLNSFQEWATGLSSNLSVNLQNLQEWGTGLVTNLKANVFTLSEELNQIQQDVETATPQELTAIQKAEQMAATLSEELNRIQQDVETGATPQELAEIQKAEQMAATLSEKLNQIQQDVETEATPQELAEIQKAEQMTSILSEELNEMEKAAETTATLSEELNELQEVVEATEEVADGVAVPETDPQAVVETKTAKAEISIGEETENLDDLAELKAIPSEEFTAPGEIAELTS